MDKSGAAIETGWKERALEALERLSLCSFDGFGMAHRPPYRSFNAGASGIAYTFWKAACALQEPRWLHRARLWIDYVLSLPDDEPVVELPEEEGSTAEIDIDGSLYHGNRGVRLVQALVAYAQNDPRHLNKAIDKFTAPAASPTGVPELLQGAPGRLVGCAILMQETGYDYFREHGDRIASGLLESAMEDEIPWRDNHLLGIAHGRGGIYYALLLWSRVSGYRLPDRFMAKLARFARSGSARDHGVSWPIDERRPERYMDTWCNGAPGLLHLWSLAYEIGGERPFLETARLTGEYCIHRDDYYYGHICCGSAGAAYGLLSLHRIDPDGPWLGHAVRFAASAPSGTVMAPYRLGLYTGAAGAACLMLDMLDPAHAAQPGFRG